MNESFADFSFYNTSLEYSEDPLSFIHSMTENTVKGKCYVSVFGGLTANSEMEALTGHTMAFFPTGTVIYEQFRQSNISGMAEYFNNLGYRSIAMHPNLATNWSRDKVYESMGFDEFYSQADFENPEYVRWISDKSTYDKIIELYENKNEDEQLFVFDVTMQGHGGYYTQTNWEHPVTLESADYSYTDEYLSSTYVSDKAFQYLIEYFEQQEEPTLIFMFGDHQPQLQTGFHELLLGKSQAELTLEETQQKYVTPFVLWTNYEIESKDDTEISTNQISSVVKENAGLKLTSYEKFIQSFSEHIPLINQNGYQDTDGVWHSFDEEGNEEDNEWLKKYEWIQYGIYCDGIEVK
jgi:phosphoglycerol transferase MdoB-like AlkP superfamily enzyme